MQVRQFRYSADNLGYIVYTGRSAMAIDGGAVDSIMAFASENDLSIEYISNTHKHPDHTMGTDELIEKSKGAYLDNQALPEKKIIELGGEKINVYHTPGHTDDSIVFHFDNIIITGDTLFNGTVGNCFSDNMNGFFKSLKRLIALPGETKVYAGHDYVEYSMAVARTIEPDNIEIDIYLKKYNPEHVVSTISQELKVNPFLRFNDASMIEILTGKNLPRETEYDRWESLMTIF